MTTFALVLGLVLVANATVALGLLRRYRNEQREGTR